MCTAPGPHLSSTGSSGMVLSSSPQLKYKDAWTSLQDRIRAQHRDVLRIARRVHPVPRVIEHLSQGISSKSGRTRVESIEAMCEILAEEGLAVFDRTREKPFPAIAQV